MAQRALFRCFQLQNGSLPPVRFLRTIVDSPHLASYVKEAVLSHCRVDRSWRLARHNPPVPPADEGALYGLCESISRRLGTGIEDWKHLHTGNTGLEDERTPPLLPVLLLPFLPNLTRLIVPSVNEINALITLESLKSQGAMGQLRSLRELDILNWHGDLFSSLWTFSLLLDLTPNLTHLRIYRLSAFKIPPYVAMSRSDWTLGLRNIHVLHLDNCSLDPASLELFLSCCPDLSVLHYQCQNPPCELLPCGETWTREDDSASPRDVLYALKPLKHSLKEFVLDDDSYELSAAKEPGEDDDWNDDAFVTFFNTEGFYALREAVHNGRVLIGLED